MVIVESMPFISKLLLVYTIFLGKRYEQQNFNITTCLLMHLQLLKIGANIDKRHDLGRKPVLVDEYRVCLE